MNPKMITSEGRDSLKLLGPMGLAMAGVIAVVMATTAAMHCGVLHGVVMWDEADYTYAAHQGVVANAFDQDGLNRNERHYHAPLSFYAIRLSTALFGLDEWSVRLPGIAISVLASAVAVLAGYNLAGGSPWARLIVGALSGLLFATAPASVLMTTTARPHPFVAFFLLLNIWTLCRYLSRPSTRGAVVFGLSLAGQFLSMEYGPVVVALSLVAIAIVRPRHLGLRKRWPFVRYSPLLPFIALHRHVWVATASCLAGIVVLWPAGIFKLSVLLNFAYYVRYAAKIGHRTLFRGHIYHDVPKYAYGWWYWESYPLLLVAMIAAAVLIALWALKQRKPVAITLAVFTFGLGAAVHGSHIMELCYSLYMVPPLVLGGPLAGLWLVRAMNAHRVRLKSQASTWQTPWSIASGATAMGLLLLAGLAIAGGQTSPATPNDQKNTKLVAVTQELGRMAEPGERVLAQAWPVVRYTLLKMGRDDIIVEPYNPANYEKDELQLKFDTHRFDWAVTAGSTTLAHQDCPLLTQLHEQWMVVSDHGDPPQEYRLYAPPTTGRRAAGYMNKQKPTLPAGRSAGR